MFLDPLPVIKFADFPAPPLVESEDSGESSHESSLGCHVCPQKEILCKLLEVKLESQNVDDPVQSSTSYIDKGHGDVAADDRFALFTGETYKIKYRVDNPGGIESATFQVSAKGEDAIIWTKTIDAVTESGEVSWDGSTKPDLDAYPGNALAEDKSPYKLKMTIRPKDLVGCEIDTAWTYFDVRLEHTWKLVDWVPTTRMGRFGLEFDPGAKELRVIVNVFYMVCSGSWINASSTYYPQFKARNDAAWSDNSRLKHTDGANIWKISVQVNNVGSASSTMVSALEDNPRQRVEEFRAADGHLCVSMRPGRGISALIFRLSSPVANLMMTESGFETEHPRNISQGVLDKQLELVKAAVEKIIEERDDDRVEMVDDPPEHYGPTFEVGFDTNAVALNGTGPVVQEVGQVIADLSSSFTMKVYAEGMRQSTETANLETQRATAVKNQLAPIGGDLEDGNTRTDEDSSKVRVVIGYRTPDERKAYRDQTFNYCAAVHEFGHSLGLPDEYQDYNTPGPWGNSPEDIAKAAFLQTRLKQLIQAEGDIAAWPEPYARHASLMSTGEEFFPRYYLTALEAFRAMLGTYDNNELNKWKIVSDAGQVVVNRALPNYAALIKAVREKGDRAVREGADVVADVVREMRTEAGSGGARVVYSKVLKRSDLTVASGFAEGDDVVYAVGAVVGRQMLHCSTYARVALPKPVIEVSEFRSKDGDDYVLLRRSKDDSMKRDTIVLRSTAFFDGTGTFTCTANGAKFYTSPQISSPTYEVDASAGKTYTGYDLEAGVELYVEGDVDDAELKLQLAATTGQVDTTEMTVKVKYESLVAPKMEMYRFSVVDTDELVPLTAEERKIGQHWACVPAHDGNPEYLQKVRVKIVIHKDAGFRSKMMLRVNDKHMAIFEQATGGRAKGNRKLRRPTQNNADRRQRVYWREYSFSRSKFVDGEYTLWLEGKAPCGGRNDALIQLCSTGFTTDWPRQVYDEIDATVFSIGEVKVLIPTTAAKTVRKPDPPATGTRPAGNQPPAEQVFDAGAVAQTLGGLNNRPFVSRNFERNPPVVLVKGSIPAGKKLLASAQVKPMGGSGPAALNFPWFLERASDDAAAIEQAGQHCDEVPLAQESRVMDMVNFYDFQKIEVLATDHGSFHLVLKTGNSICSIINVVIVEATAYTNHEASNVGATATEVAMADAIDNNGLLVMHTGPVPWNDADPTRLANLPTEVCALLAGRVLLVGGGADGKRGVDRVFPGWIQNKTVSNLTGTYRDYAAAETLTTEGKFLEVQTNGQLLQVGVCADYYFHDTSPDLGTELTVNAGQPMLDTGNRPVGGRKSSLGHSRIRRLAQLPAGGLGEDVVVVANDCPGTEFLVTHKSRGAAILTRAQYGITFKAYLCAWTDATMADTGTGVGDLLFTSVGELEWKVKGDYDVTWNDTIQGQDPTQRRSGNARWFTTGTVAARTALNATITSAFGDHPAQPAEGRIEVRSPTPIRSFAWDAKTT